LAEDLRGISAALTRLAADLPQRLSLQKGRRLVLLDLLHPAAKLQAGLFDKPDDARRVALMRTVDRQRLSTFYPFRRFAFGWYVRNNQGPNSAPQSFIVKICPH
jgi:hypothetical protein